MDEQTFGQSQLNFLLTSKLCPLNENCQHLLANLQYKLFLLQALLVLPTSRILALFSGAVSGMMQVAFRPS